jgi:AcrR family transcriptional regulator
MVTIKFVYAKFQCYGEAVQAELGLRERKKQRTHQQIAEAAWRLFADRGFEHVTVAEIAAAAELSEATVFNYFPTKEDLVFHRMEAFEDELLAAIRERPLGESIVQAFGRFALQPRGFLASDDPRATEGMREAAQIIAGSPALLARERQIFERYTAALAAVIAHERGLGDGGPEAWVIANALIGLHRALIDYVQGQAREGVPNRQIAENLHIHGTRALALLEHGLG